MNDDPKPDYVTNKRAQKTGRVMAVVMLVLGLGAIYWLWPSGVMDQPLASITVMTAVRMLWAVALAVFLLYGFVILWRD